MKRLLRAVRRALATPLTSCGLVVMPSLLMAGCGSGTTGTLYDFAENFPIADTLVETKLVDFGTPEARSFMMEGWHSLDERWNGRVPFVWGMGNRSVMELTVTDPRPLDLIFECRPFPANSLREDAEILEQAVTVVVNDLTAGTVRLREGFNLYSVSVPREALVPGRNRVEFRYAFSPKEAGLLRGRGVALPLTVAWGRLWFHEAHALGVPSAFSGDDRRLVLPAYTRVDYFLHAPPGSVLRLDRLEAWSTSSAEKAAVLEIRVHADGSEDDTIFEVPVSSLRQSLPLPLPAGAVDTRRRISFFVRPDASDRGMSGLTLYSPALVIPRSRKVQDVKEPLARVSSPVDLPDPESGRPNVLIYLIDTLRADHVGAYGYSLDTSPSLDALARDGILFANAIAQSSWTRASVASIFTGLHPRSHAVNGR